MTNKTMGRPKVENPRNERLNIRLTKEEKEKILSNAKKSGMSLTDYVVSKLLK
ncbi:plasmid mobilization protein [Amedibacillus dolichus]|uniref:DUF1778 domain-containing protein n=1 Tax=Amedibacillus dolichus DSM 3991 TaxID=428127 RepID=A8RC36_9FIRM|nr:DUF1778 domain-containing protein [Amedibacillus dolichus]EDP11337.1 hypothetical protein EUBDOL_01257 [Amedibacillus dolichus DSM 3991]